MHYTCIRTLDPKHLLNPSIFLNKKSKLKIKSMNNLFNTIITTNNVQLVL